MPKLHTTRLLLRRGSLLWCSLLVVLSLECSKKVRHHLSTTALCTVCVFFQLSLFLGVDPCFERKSQTYSAWWIGMSLFSAQEEFVTADWFRCQIRVFSRFPFATMLVSSSFVHGVCP